MQELSEPAGGYDMALEEFINDFFIQPIINPQSAPYNPVNTLVYGAILLAASFFIVFPVLDRRGIKFNFKFMRSLLPYILLGISARAINSADLLPFIQKTANPLELGFWTFTPGIWISVFLITVAGLLIAKMWSKGNGEKFYRIFLGIGMVFALPPFLFLLANFVEWTGFLIAVAAVAVVFFAVKMFVDVFMKNGLMKDKLNQLAVLGQALDGTASAVAVSFYGFGEQHVVSNALMQAVPQLGMLAFILVKVALILLILHYTEKEIETEL